MMVEVLRI